VSFGDLQAVLRRYEFMTEERKAVEKGSRELVEIASTCPIHPDVTHFVKAPGTGVFVCPYPPEDHGRRSDFQLSDRTLGISSDGHEGH